MSSRKPKRNRRSRPVRDSEPKRTAMIGGGITRLKLDPPPMDYDEAHERLMAQLRPERTV